MIAAISRDQVFVDIRIVCIEIKHKLTGPKKIDQTSLKLAEGAQSASKNWYEDP